MTSNADNFSIWWRHHVWGVNQNQTTIKHNKASSVSIIFGLYHTVSTMWRWHMHYSDVKYVMLLGCLFNNLIIMVKAMETSKLRIAGESNGDWWFPSQRANNAESFPVSICRHENVFCKFNIYLVNVVMCTKHLRMLIFRTYSKYQFTFSELWHRKVGGLTTAAEATDMPAWLYLLTHWSRDIFKWIFLNENVWISVKIPFKFVPLGPINNIPTMAQITACRWLGAVPLSKPMMA